MKRSAISKIVSEEIGKIKEASISKRFQKATEEYQKIELKMQTIVKKFIAEKNPKKKEQYKNQLRDLTVKKKKAEQEFKAALLGEPITLSSSRLDSLI
tara:strand:+ start:171 stop:464 length:294 start_codon:yes stop_codon:yes gene_type:complete